LLFETLEMGEKLFLYTTSDDIVIQLFLAIFYGSKEEQKPLGGIYKEQPFILYSIK
jgi:hypothetical protein